MDVEKKKKTIINFVYYALIIGVFYFFMKYAFWLLFPVLLSFFVAMCLQKPVNAIAKKTPIKKGPASVLCVVLVLLIFTVIIALIGTSAVNYLKGFFEYLRTLFNDTDTFLNDIKNWLLSISEKLPKAISKILNTNINQIFSKLSNTLADETKVLAQETAKSATQKIAEAEQSSKFNFDFSMLSSPIASVVSTAKQLPSMLLSVVITIVMSCFLTAGYSDVTNFIMRQLSDQRQSNILRAKYLLRTSFLKILKAYCIIVGITFLEMTIGLFALKMLGIYKSGYIVIIALATAVVDIFPVLGTGTVIFPWAIYSLFTGETKMAIGLLVIYALITVIRQVIEPKLVAGQLGLPPFVTIIGMFLGLKVFGFIGMIIMPIIIIMLKLLNDEGILHLWKTEENSSFCEVIAPDEKVGE